MKKLRILFLCLIISAPLCLAQTNKPTITEDFKSSVLNQPGQDFPQVNSQGYARFRIIAPEAQSIVVTLGVPGVKGGTSLTKGEDGSWTGTTAAPQEEGFHYYHITIDGGIFNDPGTLNFYGSTRWESGIEIPAHDQDFYALADVPHGNVRQILFPQKAQIAHAVHMSTLHLITIKVNPADIRFSICSMDGVRMKLHGVTRAVPTL